MAVAIACCALMQKPTVAYILYTTSSLKCSGDRIASAPDTLRQITPTFGSKELDCLETSLTATSSRRLA